MFHDSQVAAQWPSLGLEVSHAICTECYYDVHVRAMHTRFFTTHTDRIEHANDNKPQVD
jgi:hypothetical protein